ncbi:hypothetical protein M231_02408 [Tremella mesenterica]|uniref:Zn(2)-C6 fungal-type domain-containing protein n=1 Tax=Tremella mesenterica TaxID=5217 RepID=A0A4Q1BQS2_TREME|nr:hypothetical protein M231_02408 [Tremella mesenterica]
MSPPPEPTPDSHPQHTQQSYDQHLSDATLHALVDPYGLDIAPELLGAEGQPDPVHRKRKTPPPSTESYDIPPDGVPRLPWEEGYEPENPTDTSQIDFQPPQNEETQIDGVAGIEGESSRNAEDERPVKKKKTRTRHAHTEPDLPEGEVEYSHPSQDPKLGPVFVHPGPNASQACVRCHRIKRKCDTNKPRCMGCTKADVPCVFELTPATSAFVQILKSEKQEIATQLATAEERIHHLELLVSTYERNEPFPPPESTQPDHNLEFDNDIPSDLSTLAQTVIAMRTNYQVQSAISSDLKSPVTGLQLPSFELAREAENAFFAHTEMSYPFLDPVEFGANMSVLYTFTESIMPVEEKRREFVFLMVTAIGMALRQQQDGVKGGSRELFERAKASLKFALNVEDIVCLQSLMLLAIYSTLDTSAAPLWHVVGLAVRVATALNLHRSFEADDKLSSDAVEQRKKLFWAVYNLEHLVTYTLNRPLAISDDIITVEMPTDTFSISLTTRTLDYRRLLGEITSTLSRPSVFKDDAPHRLLSLRIKLDGWLSSIPSSNHTIDLSSHAYFELQYHSALSTLYAPSPLSSTISSETLQTLYTSSCKAVELFLLGTKYKTPISFLSAVQQLRAVIGVLYTLCMGINISSEEKGKRGEQCSEVYSNVGKTLPEGNSFVRAYIELRSCLTTGEKEKATDVMLSIWRGPGEIGFDTSQLSIEGEKKSLEREGTVWGQL